MSGAGNTGRTHRAAIGRAAKRSQRGAPATSGSRSRRQRIIHRSNVSSSSAAFPKRRPTSSITVRRHAWPSRVTEPCTQIARLWKRRIRSSPRLKPARSRDNDPGTRYASAAAAALRDQHRSPPTLRDTSSSGSIRRELARAPSVITIGSAKFPSSVKTSQFIRLRLTATPFRFSSSTFRNRDLMQSLAVDAADNLFVDDTGSEVDEFANSITNPKKTRVFSGGYVGNAVSIATDAKGNLYIASTDNSYQNGRIERYAPDAEGSGQPTSTIVLPSGVHLLPSIAERGRVLYVDDVFKGVDLYHARKDGSQSPFYSFAASERNFDGHRPVTLNLRRKSSAPARAQEARRRRRAT